MLGANLLAWPIYLGLSGTILGKENGLPNFRFMLEL